MRKPATYEHDKTTQTCVEDMGRRHLELQHIVCSQQLEGLCQRTDRIKRDNHDVVSVGVLVVMDLCRGCGHEWRKSLRLSRRTGATSGRVSCPYVFEAVRVLTPNVPAESPNIRKCLTHEK